VPGSGSEPSNQDGRFRCCSSVDAVPTFSAIHMGGSGSGNRWPGPRTWTPKASGISRGKRNVPNCVVGTDNPRITGVVQAGMDRLCPNPAALRGGLYRSRLHQTTQSGGWCLRGARRRDPPVERWHGNAEAAGNLPGWRSLAEELPG